MGDKAPEIYALVENGVENEINVFPKRMKGADDRLMFAPYGGAMFKHPGRNIVAQLMSGMDYIIFFDFEKNKHFAIHQKGTPSFDDEYPSLGRDQMFFTDAAVSDDYLFALYWNEGNVWETRMITALRSWCLTGREISWEDAGLRSALRALNMMQPAM